MVQRFIMPIQSGKTTIAVSLARGVAEEGRKVVLVLMQENFKNITLKRFPFLKNENITVVGSNSSIDKAKLYDAHTIIIDDADRCDNKFLQEMIQPFIKDNASGWSKYIYIFAGSNI